MNKKLTLPCPVRMIKRYEIGRESWKVGELATAVEDRTGDYRSSRDQPYKEQVYRLRAENGTERDFSTVYFEVDEVPMPKTVKVELDDKDPFEGLFTQR